MDPSDRSTMLRSNEKRKLIDELNRVALTVQNSRRVETPSIMGFLQGIYDRYVGNVGVPRIMGGVEGFQATQLSTAQELAKAQIKQFYDLWISLSSDYKLSDFSNIVTNFKYSAYTSETNTPDYITSNFSYLKPVIGELYWYSSGGKSSAVCMGTRTYSYTWTMTITFIGFNKTINQNSSGSGIANSYGYCNGSYLGIPSGITYTFTDYIDIQRVTYTGSWTDGQNSGTFSGFINEKSSPASYIILPDVENAYYNFYMLTLYDIYNKLIDIHGMYVLVPLGGSFSKFTTERTSIINTSLTHRINKTSYSCISNLNALQSNIITQTLSIIDKFIQMWALISNKSKYAVIQTYNPMTDNNNVTNSSSPTVNLLPSSSKLTIIQISSIFTKYKDAITTITPDIAPSIYTNYVSEFITNTYTPARRYIQDSDLSATTVTSRANARGFMKSDGTMTDAFSSKTLTDLITIQTYCLEGIRNTVDALIIKYYARTGTTRPAADTIDSNTTLESLKTLRDKYMPLWAAILTSLRTVPTAIDTYVTARTDSRIPTTDPNYIQDNLPAGSTYTITPRAPYVNIDKSILTTTRLASDASGNVSFGYYVNGHTSFLSGITATRATTMTVTDTLGNTVTIQGKTNTSSGITDTADPALPFRTSSSLSLPFGTTYQIYLTFSAPVNISRITATLTGSGAINAFIEGSNTPPSNPFTTSLPNSILDIRNRSVSQGLSNILTSDSGAYRYFTVFFAQLTDGQTASISGLAFQSPTFQFSAATEVAIVDDTLLPYTTKLNAILASFRQQAQTALTNFTDRYSALQSTFPTDYSTNPDYAMTREAYAAYPTDQTTTIPGLKVISDINAKKKYYEDALASLNLAGKRTALRKAILDFNATVAAVTPANIPGVILPDLSGAKADAAALLDSTGAATATFQGYDGATLDSKRTGTFEKGTKALVNALIAAYKTYRDANYLKFKDMYTDTGDLSLSNETIAALDLSTSANVVTVRDQFITATTGYWPLLKAYSSKTDARVGVLNALTDFLALYNEFATVRQDVRPSYTNANVQRIFDEYVGTDYEPLDAFMGQPEAELITIKNNYRGTYFTDLVADLRSIFRDRVDTFNARRTDNQAIISRSGETEPGLDAALATSDFVDSLDAANLSLERKKYYGDPTAKPVTLGYIKMLENLITRAILENKRKDTVAAIETFNATYAANTPYISPQSLSSRVKTYQAAAETYYAAATSTRQKKLLDLVLGAKADETIGETAPTSLFGLQYVYEQCTRSIVADMIASLKTGYDEKNKLAMPWTPGADVVQAVGNEESTEGDMASVVALRDQYAGFWSSLLTAATKQVTDQITLFESLKGTATSYTMPLSTAASASLPAKPDAATPFYNLRSIYDSYDTAGVSLMADIRTWVQARIAEYDSLYKKYDAFQKDPFVVNVQDPADLADFTNTITTDDATVAAYTFYTTAIETLLSVKLTAYVDAPDGALTRLKAFVQARLQSFLPEFKKQWEASTSKEAQEAEKYTSYDEDLEVVNSSAVTSQQLENVMTKYFKYTDQLREANLQQEVLYTMYDFNATLYQANIGIPLNADATTVADQRNIIESANYLQEILEDAITDKGRLREIQEVYFQATYRIADKIVADLNTQQDNFLNLYQTYETFRTMERRNEAGEKELADPAAVRETITIVNVQPGKDGALSVYKQNLKTTLDALKATNSNTTKESIRAEVEAFATQVNQVRKAVVEEMYVWLREDIQSALRAYITDFAAKYDAMARQEPKDPYTTRTTDAEKVAEGTSADYGTLISLLSSYTSYTTDLVTSNYQVRALQAITSFFTDLYVANLPILPPTLETEGISDTILRAIRDAGAEGGDTIIKTVVDLNATNNRTALQGIRIAYKAAADAFAPYVIARLKGYITRFSNMHTQYSTFFTVNQTLGENGPFFAPLASLSLANPSGSYMDTMDAYLSPTQPTQFTPSLRTDLDRIRVGVLADTETLRGFLKTEGEAIVTQYAQEYSVAPSPTTLAENTPAYNPVETLAADRALITGGEYMDFAALLDRYTLLARQLVVSRKQQKLLNTIDLFANQLLQPNEEAKLIPPVSGVVAEKKGQVVADEVDARTLPADATSREATLDEKMAALATYAAHLDSQQSAYDGAISALLTAIRLALATNIRQVKELYRENKAILRSTVPESILAADANIDGGEKDEARVGTVEAPATINRIRDRYMPAVADLFTLVRGDLLGYMTEMTTLAAAYGTFTSIVSGTAEGDSPTLLTNFPTLPENPVALPTAERSLIEPATVMTDAFIGTVNGAEGIREKVVLGTYPQLRSFVIGELVKYVEYFNGQYAAISQKTGGFKTYYDAVKQETLDISGIIDPYLTYDADKQALVNPTITSAKLGDLLVTYQTWTTNLGTTNLQYRVGTVVFDFLDLLAKNYTILHLPATSEFVLGMTDAIGTAEAPGLAYAIGNNLNTAVEQEDRTQLLAIERRFLGLRTRLVDAVKVAIDAIIVEYTEHRSGYLTFLDKNRERFLTSMPDLPATYTDTTVADRATVAAFAAYSADFVTTTNAIRDSTWSRLLGIKEFIGNQLDAYIRAFKTAYDATTSNTRPQNIVYSAENETADLAMATGQRSLVALMLAYTSNTSRLLLSRKEEAVYKTVQDYADLYSENLVIVGAAERTASVVALASRATAEITEAKRRKNVGNSWENYELAMAALDVTLKKYEDGIAEWMGILKTRLEKDIKAFRDLYVEYLGFEGNTTLASFFDISGIPTKIRQLTAVEQDLASVAGLKAGDAAITNLRETYYSDPNFSQFPAFVRFIKEQLANYIAEYTTKYDDLPANIKPNCSFDGTNKKCSVGGEISLCIDSVGNARYVGTRAYVSVDDLTTLKTMIGAYIDYTPCLQAATRINIRKIQTRTIIKNFEDAKARVLLEAKSLKYSFLAATVSPPSDKLKVEAIITQTAIDALFDDYKIYITQLCFETMSRFVDLYVGNRYLEPYFIREARDIYNKFNGLMLMDISGAMQNLQDSYKKDYGETNPIERNIALIQEYAGYCKTILDNQDSAKSVYDATEAMRTKTFTQIAQVDEERKDVAGLAGLIFTAEELAKADKDTAKNALTSELLLADVSGATEAVKKATYISEMTPIYDTYFRHYTELRTKVHALATQEILKFKSDMEKYGSLQRFFSEDILAVKSALDTKPNDLTRLEPVDDITSKESRTLVETYRERQVELVRQADPKTGAMYSNARRMAAAAIDQYVLRFQQVSQLAGGALLTFQTTANAPILGTLLQTRAQADFDKSKLAKATTFEVILFFYDMYEEREQKLLKTMYGYGAKVIDDGFLKLYATIAEKGLESYISEAMKTAKAEVEANRQRIREETVAYDPMLQMLQLYMGLSENVKLEVKRAEVRQVVEKALAILLEIEKLQTRVRFSQEVPTSAEVQKVLTNISTIKSVPILQQVDDQYTSVLALVNTEFASYGATTIKSFQTFYEEAKLQQVTNFLPQATQAAAVTADADASTMATKSKSEIAQLVQTYSDALTMGKKALADSQQAINQQKTRNQTLTYLNTFKQSLETARTIPALVPDLVSADADVATDTETIEKVGTPASTLVSLQKKYYTANVSVVGKVRQAFNDAVTAFTRTVTAAQAKKATLPTSVRLAFMAYVNDIKKADTSATVLEMRDMLRKYAELSASVTAVIPASSDVTGARAEVLQMIQNFDTLRGNMGTLPIQLTTATRQANPAADRAVAEKATTLEVLVPIRTKYVQMIYEVTTKLEEAKEGAAAGLETARASARATVLDFQKQLAEARLSLDEYPQVKAARDAVTTSLASVDEGSIETAKAVQATYKSALDTVIYGKSAATAEDRAAKRQVAMVAMSRFANTYQAQAVVADRFSAKLRQLALQLPGDVTRVQDPTLSMGDLDALRTKYDEALTAVLSELVGIQQDQVSEVTTLLRTFLSRYRQIPNIDSLPSYLKVDTRIVEMDLATLGNPAVAADTVQTLRQKYTDLMKALVAQVPDLDTRLLATAAAKDAVRAVLRELNQLFVENMGLFGRLSPEVRTRIQKIADTFRFIGGKDIGAIEVQGLLEDYTKALADFKAVLRGQPTQQAVLDASLKGILGKFLEAYKEADIYKLAKTDFNYIQLLLRNQSNVYVTRDVTGAIRAYSKGIEVLGTVPKTTAQFTETPQTLQYNKLVETINYFMTEWSIRSLGRAIANDRLFLNNLKTNADSYKSMYKVPPPNMRNYGSVLEGLVGEYQQGLRLLRTYPMKN